MSMLKIIAGQLKVSVNLVGELKKYATNRLFYKAIESVIASFLAALRQAFL